MQESKVANFGVTLCHEITGIDFDYVYLPATGVAGGAVVCWRRDLWRASAPVVRRFSITVELTPLNGPGLPWWFTNVYGPSARADKPGFLSEIRDVRAASGGPWLLCGDFNLIYKASDKNNGILDRANCGDSSGSSTTYSLKNCTSLAACSPGPTGVTSRRWSALTGLSPLLSG